MCNYKKIPVFFGWKGRRRTNNVTESRLRAGKGTFGDFREGGHGHVECDGVFLLFFGENVCEKKKNSSKNKIAGRKHG
jgi:hypothetical protein